MTSFKYSEVLSVYCSVCLSLQCLEYYLFCCAYFYDFYCNAMFYMVSLIFRLLHIFHLHSKGNQPSKTGNSHFNCCFSLLNTFNEITDEEI